MAFGVHRFLDTGSAFLGPLLAFGLLSLTPRTFDVVFVPSFSIALIGLGVIVLFVNNHTRSRDVMAAALSWREFARLLLLPRFRVLVIAAGLFARCVRHQLTLPGVNGW